MHIYGFILILFIILNASCNTKPLPSIDNINRYFDEALKQQEFIHTYRNYKKIAANYFTPLPEQPGATDYPEALIDYSAVMNIITQSHKQYCMQSKDIQQWLNLDIPNFQLNQKNGYIQKVLLPKNSQVIFFGDLHGSIQSLIRVLSKLKRLGHFDQNFRLKTNNYIVFLGDFVDYGRNGIDTLCTALYLRMINPQQVFLCRGNHEDRTHNDDYPSSNHGFAREIRSRYKTNDTKKLLTKIYMLYEQMPQAIFLGFENNPSTGFVQCCHGGIEKNAATTINLLLTHPAISFAKLTDKAFLPDHNSWTNFNWGEFTGDPSIKDAYRNPSHNWKKGYIKEYSIHGAQKFMQNMNIKAIFRGHKDQEDFCKFLIYGINDPIFPLSQNPIISKNLIETKTLHGDAHHIMLNIFKNLSNGFTLESLPKNKNGNWLVAPIFTLSNASSTKTNDSEGCGILTISDNWENSKFQLCTLEHPILAFRHLIWASILTHESIHNLKNLGILLDSEVEMVKNNPAAFLEAFQTFLHIPITTKIDKNGQFQLLLSKNKTEYLNTLNIKSRSNLFFLNKLIQKFSTP